jgi:EAL domain-containing protein (putative c-di-GMP-specific phosphodiesterase class I)
MFHATRLKIDRRFIEHALGCGDDAAIVRAAIGLAHELGIEVVAEGVETAGQRDFLIAAGCKIGQGHLFGMAARAAEAGELLRRNLQFAAA